MGDASATISKYQSRHSALLQTLSSLLFAAEKGVYTTHSSLLQRSLNFQTAKIDELATVAPYPAIQDLQARGVALTASLPWLILIPSG